MSKKIVASWIISLIAVIAVSALIIYRFEKNLLNYVNSYQEMVYKTERAFIESIPVYRDFATPALERELMTFDLKAHALEVARHGIKPLKNTDDINSAVKSGKLISAGTGSDDLYYFHNVQRENRYLTPLAKYGLELVASRFQQKLNQHKSGLPTVKLAVSSVIRTVDYQQKIFGRKFVSTHSYGGCFDIFFDDYFIKLPVPENTGGSTEKVRQLLHTRTGYLLGDALREQLKSVLMETLLELQREGKIYVYFEDDNRCYHITVLVK